MIRLACLVAMLFAVPASAAPEEAPLNTALIRSRTPAKLQAECDRLAAKGPHRLGGYQHLNAFIDMLVAERAEADLRFIITHELPGWGHAAYRYAKYLGPRDGLHFARTMKGYRGWKGMVWTLSHSGNPAVRTYIGEVSAPVPLGFGHFVKSWLSIGTGTIWSRPPGPTSKRPTISPTPRAYGRTGDWVTWPGHTWSASRKRSPSRQKSTTASFRNEAPHVLRSIDCESR